ncbi:MAG TPA: Asp-tRNA(Asn)/Glu-tRNA(Gln) amidotransferase subunit GatC [Thiothrix sp.]|nr:Asp-tRNA(Asn)/Glu-tRNA(Gln) amidotransferase subunit GatC [Thiothrix sp.]
MSLTVKDVKQIAHLARLSIDDDNVQTYADNLSGILALVAQMNEVDTDAIEPMYHPQEVMQRLRDDKVTEQVERERFQKIAPVTEAGLYLVPKVIE